MKLKVVEQTDLLNSLELQGSLDCEGVQEISNQFSRMTAVMRVDTLIDISKVDYISSLGLGMLVSAAKTVKLAGKKIFFIGPQQKVKDVIVSSGLKQILTVAETRAEALIQLQGAKA